MPNPAHPTCDTSTLLTVQVPEDIEFLIKESEVITGRAGRTFVIGHAERLPCRVHWHPLALKVEQLDTAGRVLSTENVPTGTFCEHRLIESLASGQLFTPRVRCCS